MTNKERMDKVDNATGELCKMLGVLAKEGVLSLEDSFVIIKNLNDKHYVWLKKNFSEPEIVAYLKEKMSGR